MKKLSLICALAVASSVVVIPEAEARRYSCGMASRNTNTYGNIFLAHNYRTRRAAIQRAKASLRYPRSWRSWSRYRNGAVASGSYQYKYYPYYLYMKRGYAWGWRSRYSAKVKALSYISYYYNGYLSVPRYRWSVVAGWNGR